MTMARLACRCVTRMVTDLILFVLLTTRTVLVVLGMGPVMLRWLNTVL